MASLRSTTSAIQRLVGVSDDGAWGPVTAGAVLKALQASQDDAGQPSAGPVEPTALRDPAAFYAALRASFGSLKQEQVNGANALLAAMGKSGWPIAWTAYGLATAWHETAHTMQPIKEYGGEAYYRRMYDIEGERPGKARELGNITPGDGARYAGRGYVQLTGRTNYKNAAAAVADDLVGNPDLAMQPEIAAKILTWGMAGGKFTGKGLRNYLPEHGPADHRQFKLARYIINGTDRASSIADVALKMQAALGAGGWA